MEPNLSELSFQLLEISLKRFDAETECFLMTFSDGVSKWTHWNEINPDDLGVFQALFKEQENFQAVWVSGLYYFYSL